MHPKILDLMQRCWEADPSNRPAFSDILAELEGLLTQVQVIPSPHIYRFREGNPTKPYSIELYYHSNTGMSSALRTGNFGRDGPRSIK